MATETKGVGSAVQMAAPMTERSRSNAAQPVPPSTRLLHVPKPGGEIGREPRRQSGFTEAKPDEITTRAMSADGPGDISFLWSGLLLPDRQHVERILLLLNGKGSIRHRVTDLLLLGLGQDKRAPAHC